MAQQDIQTASSSSYSLSNLQEIGQENLLPTCAVFYCGYELVDGSSITQQWGSNGFVA